MLQGNKLGRLTNLIITKQITKVMIEYSDEIAEIKEVVNESYVEFTNGIKCRDFSDNKHTCFGSSIALLDYEKTLTVNGLGE